MCMHTRLLKEKLFEQAEIYQTVKDGNVSSVQYQETHDEQWGTRDGNYINRLRLAYYLLYAHIYDEEITVYLFREELKDRKTNSFQGIGSTLNVLTTVLNRCNADSKYDAMLEEAKNANFDCFCGFDKDCVIDDEINGLSLLDCIFLSQDLGYKDAMESLVIAWKETITEWTDSNRITLTRFNSFLGKEQENEDIYKYQLESALRTGKTFDIISAYNKVVRHHIDARQFETAYLYLHDMVNNVDFSEIECVRLFGDVLEEAFEIICGGIGDAFRLWEWARPFLQNRKNMYGNLFTKGIAAAKCVGDPYAVHLEKEYLDWMKRVGLR